MQSYKIEVFYRTGDSYNSYDTSTVLEMEWKNIDNAKNALQRIKEHYAWYQFTNDPLYMKRKKADEPMWHKGLEYDFCLSFVLDNGKEVMFSAPWVGYFEDLHSAKILSDDSDMEFTVS